MLLLFIITMWLRRRKRKWPAAILLISLCSHIVNAQQQRFRIVRKHEVIGYLTASRITTAATTSIDIESFTRFAIVFGFSLKICQNDTFSNGVLTASFFAKTLNGRLRSCHRVHRDNDRYLTSGGDGPDNTAGGPDNTGGGPIYYTTSSLYYTEPTNITRVYSPNLLAFGTIIRVSPGFYELSLPDGNKNYYTYKNGICRQVQVVTSWTTIYFINEIEYK